MWDTIVPGLHLRIGYGGTRTYTVTTRINGAQRRRKIGTTATHSLAQAREEARAVLNDAAKGIDSASREAKRKAAEQVRREAERASAGTFRAVAEAWLADTGKRGGARLRSRQAIVSQLERDVYPVLGASPIAEISRSEIRDLVRAIAVRRPVAANRCLAHIRRALNWAVSQDKLETSPATGIDPLGEEKSRERVLNDTEIAAVWSACDALGYPFGLAI